MGRYGAYRGHTRNYFAGEEHEGGISRMKWRQNSSEAFVWKTKEEAEDYRVRHWGSQVIVVDLDQLGGNE